MDKRKQEQISEEIITSVDLGKVYLAFDRRNQWTDWSGSTAVMRRNWGIALSLRDAMHWAESSRLQGTSFLIDELPIICVRCKSGALLLGERNSARPMDPYRSVASALTGIRTVASLRDAFVSSKGKQSIHHLLEGPAAITGTEGTYYLRESSPGKGRNGLAWSLKPKALDDTPMREIVADMQRLVSRR